jgi:hypothetical protein
VSVDFIEAEQQRAHTLAVTRTICRWSFLAVAVLIGACTYRCDPDARTERIKARALDDYYRGTAIECRRWTE